MSANERAVSPLYDLALTFTPCVDTQKPVMITVYSLCTSIKVGKKFFSDATLLLPNSCMHTSPVVKTTYMLKKELHNDLVALRGCFHKRCYPCAQLPVNKTSHHQHPTNLPSPAKKMIINSNSWNFTFLLSQVTEMMVIINWPSHNHPSVKPLSLSNLTFPAGQTVLI